MTSFVKQQLSNPVLVCGGIFLFSALSLMSALIAQFVYGLQPCILCLYQRWPFGITAVLGIIGLILLHKEENRKKAALIILVSGIVYMGGGIIAFYHHGVEQHWWKSFLEGCAVNFDASNPEDLMALIESAQAVRCDEIPWTDPIFNLSMAAWNMIISPIAALGCWLSSLMVVRKANGVL